MLSIIRQNCRLSIRLNFKTRKSLERQLILYLYNHKSTASLYLSTPTVIVVIVHDYSYCMTY